MAGFARITGFRTTIAALGPSITALATSVVATSVVAASAISALVVSALVASATAAFATLVSASTASTSAISASVVSALISSTAATAATGLGGFTAIALLAPCEVVIAAFRTGPVALTLCGGATFVPTVAGPAVIAPLLGRRDLDRLTDEKVGFDISEGLDVDHGCGDFTDYGVDLADPLATRKLHDLAEAGSLSSERRHQAAFVADLADMTLESHTFTEPRRRCGAYECS